MLLFLLLEMIQFSGKFSSSDFLAFVRHNRRFVSRFHRFCCGQPFAERRGFAVLRRKTASPVFLLAEMQGAFSSPCDRWKNPFRSKMPDFSLPTAIIYLFISVPLKIKIVAAGAKRFLNDFFFFDVGSPQNPNLGKRAFILFCLPPRFVWRGTGMKFPLRAFVVLSRSYQSFTSTLFFLLRWAIIINHTSLHFIFPLPSFCDVRNAILVSIAYLSLHVSRSPITYITQNIIFCLTDIMYWSDSELWILT